MQAWIGGGGMAALILIWELSGSPKAPKPVRVVDQTSQPAVAKAAKVENPMFKVSTGTVM